MIWIPLCVFSTEVAGPTVGVSDSESLPHSTLYRSYETHQSFHRITTILYGSYRFHINLLFSDVKINAGCHLSNSIISSGAIIEPKEIVHLTI